MCFDGRGTKKTHVNWEWYIRGKELGGPRLKDLRLQGIALVTKWVAKATQGSEP